MTYDGLEDDAKWPRPDRVHLNAALSGGIGGQAMEKIACVEFVAISDRERFESSIARHWRGKFVGGRRRVVIESFVRKFPVRALHSVFCGTKLLPLLN